MEWIEVELPEACKECQEEDCYNCDHAGERWQLSPEDQARIRCRLAEKAAERNRTRKNR